MKESSKFIIGLLLGAGTFVVVSTLLFCAHSSKINSLPIDPNELHLTVEKLRGEDFLCISAEPKNWFADYQFPAYQVESNSITIGFYWQRSLPVPVRTVHSDWPLLFGPLGTNFDGAAIFLEGNPNPVAHLRNTGSWTITK